MTDVVPQDAGERELHVAQELSTPVADVDVRPLPVATVVLHLRDGVEQTVACVSALAANTPDDLPFQTVVVDDATTDRTSEFLLGLSGDLDVVRHDVSEGYTTSVSRAVGMARAPVVVFLDQSVVVEEGWLRPLLARLERDPQVAAVQGCVVGRNGRVVSAGGQFGADRRPTLKLRGANPSRSNLGTAVPDFVDGLCVAVRREAYDQSGGFDVGYPDGVSRSADLSSRLVAAGWSLAYEPASVVSCQAPPDVRSGARRLLATWSHLKAPTSRARSVAFYLPQFHPIPENDRWWGAGFTEWTNVTAARPRFGGHEQPDLPADLGFYDLRVAETRQTQADLARAHGIDAFCYYHYWFGGRRLLDQPFDEVLRLGVPDMAFCLCWANEDWRRNWDGRSGEVLVEQTYSPDDDRAHIRWLIQAFGDPRYFRVDDKPLFLVYRASQMPEPTRTLALWRDEARSAGIGELLLCRVESFDSDHSDPRDLGFDASVEFQPDWAALQHVSPRADLPPSVYDYGHVVDSMLAKPAVPWRRFPTVTPGWDNTPRNQTGSIVLNGSDPDLYAGWVSSVVERERSRGVEDPVVFVNAWNEWGEGAHLEPSRRWGSSYLEAHRDAVGAPLGSRPPRSIGVCIAGMHRSGTSLTASWLERCGLPIHAGRVVGPAAGNPRGHFEDQDFMSVNEFAIRLRWPHADAWKVVDDRPCHLSGLAKAGALEVVSQRQHLLGQWGWKDPRSTLLLEAWADVVDHMRTLLLWRPCRDVVASLLRRSAQTTDPIMQIDGDTAVRVWLAYNRRVCRYRRLYPSDTLLVSTASVVAQTSTVHQLLRERLGLALDLVPVADVFEPELLTTRSDHASSAVVPFEREIAEVEDQLAELSDV